MYTSRWEILLMPPMRHTRRLLHSTSTRQLELLNTRLCDLDLSIKESIFQKAVDRARRQMRRAGIRKLKPLYYISTGYGCVAGTQNISLGFWDANEELRTLHAMFQDRVYSTKEIYQVVTHEVGHAFNYAYKLYRRQDFRRIFKVKGHFFNSYPTTEYFYSGPVNPWSRDYVNPLGDHYAQTHPDEDFAETFEYYLSHQSTWRRKYRNYPGALEKLEFVENIIWELGEEEPEVTRDPEWIIDPLEDLDQTVGQFFKIHGARTRRLRRAATGFVDPELKELFRARPRVRDARKLEQKYLSAAAFMRENKRILVPRVTDWMGVDEVVVGDFLDKCIARAAALDLWMRYDDYEKQLIALTAFLTMRASEYYHCGKYYAGSNLD